MGSGEQPSVKVTVIVPVYNVSRYLREALDSVVSQTYPDLEIIVVDDGSDDGSGEICDAYAARDPRIIVVHQDNGGLSAARNTGLERMTGQALMFLDSDDAVCPETVGTLLEAMLDGKADMAVCRYAFFRTEDGMTPEKGGKKEPALAPGRYDGKAAMRAVADGTLNHAVWNKMYRADLWRDLRFPAGRVYEDLAVVWPLMSRIGSVVTIPGAFCMIRKRTGSITEVDSVRNQQDWLDSYGEFEAFVTGHTPEVFSEEQARRISRRKQSEMAKRFAWHSCGMKDPEERERFRQRILALADREQIRRCGLPVRAAWFLIRRCPGLLRKTVPVYRFLAVKTGRVLQR